MDPSAALLAGLAAGLAIAMQFGAVSLLLVETAVASGPRAGAAAGVGVAAADLVFAVVAAGAGGAVGAVLSAHEAEIRVVGAAALAAVAVSGLVTLLRSRQPAAGGADGLRRPGGGAAATHFTRFLAITIANPLTIVSFAALATALSLAGPASAAAFALGVGLASTVWHVALTLTAGHARRWLTPRARRGLAVGGRIAVLAIAAHLALPV
jgi:threonine/homoserine/homoserine lactone efflux protein